MTAYQEGFVKQCEARGVNPSVVAKYAKEYFDGQKAVNRLLAKRAEDAKKAFDSMTPYQQGFALRCHQRGITAEKVASWVMSKKAGRISPALGWSAGLPAEADPNGKPTGDDVAAVIGALENANYDVDKAELEDRLAVDRGNNADVTVVNSAVPTTLDKLTALLASGKAKATDLYGKAKAKGDEYYGKAKAKATDLYGKAKAKGDEYYGKAKAKGEEVYHKGKDFLKTPRGKAVAAGGGAALTAALLGAYLMSRKRKKKAKK